MKRPIIVPEKCQNCPVCKIQEECPKNAVIREHIQEKPWIDFYKCSGCMKCIVFCNNRAIQELSKPCDSQGRSGW